MPNDKEQKSKKEKTRDSINASSNKTSQTDSSEDGLKFEGEVIEKLPDNKYRVKIKVCDEEGHEYEHIVLAYVSGKMRMNSITIAVKDKVRIEVTPYDLRRGRIIFRSK